MKSFDKGNLKHVETEEKKFNPTAQGNLTSIQFIFLACKYLQVSVLDAQSKGSSLKERCHGLCILKTLAFIICNLC